MRFAVAVWVVAAGIVSGHGDLHESILRVTRQIADAPEDPALHVLRAGLHLAHEDHAAAAADYDRAERLGGDLAPIRLGRGKVLLAVGRPEDACAELDRLLAAEPRHVEALVTRARARAIRQDAAGAAADFSAAIDASARPEPEYYLERAEALARAVPPRLVEAIRGLDEGLARLGATVITLQLAALGMEEEAGLFEDALQRLDGIASNAPRREPWLERRGDLLRRIGRDSEAREAYAAALDALSALPPRVRATRTSVDLENRCRRALEELAAPK